VTEEKQQPHQDDKNSSPDGEPPPLGGHPALITTKNLKNEGYKMHFNAINERQPWFGTSSSVEEQAIFS
jgi:hypothetical protein